MSWQRVGSRSISRRYLAAAHRLGTEEVAGGAEADMDTAASASVAKSTAAALALEGLGSLGGSAAESSAATDAASQSALEMSTGALNVVARGRGGSAAGVQPSQEPANRSPLLPGHLTSLPSLRRTTTLSRMAKDQWHNQQHDSQRSLDLPPVATDLPVADADGGEVALMSQDSISLAVPDGGPNDREHTHSGAPAGSRRAFGSLVLGAAAAPTTSSVEGAAGSPATALAEAAAMMQAAPLPTGSPAAAADMALQAAVHATAAGSAAGGTEGGAPAFVNSGNRQRRYSTRTARRSSVVLTAQQRLAMADGRIASSAADGSGGAAADADADGGPKSSAPTHVPGASGSSFTSVASSAAASCGGASSTRPLKVARRRRRRSVLVMAIEERKQQAQVQLLQQLLLQDANEGVGGL